MGSLKRRELKECAKQLLKINYWKAVLAGIILSLIGGSGVVSVVERSSSGSFDEVIGAVETDDFGLVLGIALGIVAVALLVNFIMTILIWNPLEVGCKKLFILCEYGTAETRCIWSVINRRDGKNVGWIMFLRTLFVSLWSLLFIIPGIIKQYEYMMIPFLLAENPQMNRKEAFEKSRQMMKGNKWAAFVLDLSFIGWSLLGIITFGLVNIFFAGPYQYLTQSQLYFRLKEQQKEESYGY